jgi:hypothetical protein
VETLITTPALNLYRRRYHHYYLNNNNNKRLQKIAGQGLFPLLHRRHRMERALQHQQQEATTAALIAIEVAVTVVMLPTEENAARALQTTGTDISAASRRRGAWRRKQVKRS